MGLKQGQSRCNQNRTVVQRNFTNVCHFLCQKEKRLQLKRVTFLGFQTPRLLGKLLDLVKKVKYLSVILESKLKWKTHIDKVRSRSIITMWQLRRRMIGRTWSSMLELYERGSGVWWISAEFSWVTRRMTYVQWLASLGITDAMMLWTIPITAIDALLGLPIWIHRSAIASIIRV